MRRREFIGLTAGVLAGTPLTVDAQPIRVPRIGVLAGYAEGDPVEKRDMSAFYEGLRQLGWIEGKNLRIDYRTAPDVEGMRSRAAELLSFGPDLIVTVLTPVTRAVRQVSASVPIMFIAVSDPIGAGFVESFSHPGGNITGFTNTEPTIGGKWLVLLLEMAPSISRVAMLFNPELANAGTTGGVYLESIQTAARLKGKELVVSAVHDAAGIDTVFSSMAQKPEGAVIVTPSGFAVRNRDRIVGLAAQYRVPTIYPNADWVKAGGLLSYGVDQTDLFRRPATYVDRILKGAKPADLPVQAPTKFYLVINLKAAGALGLAVPTTLLTIADEEIE
jgi:putative tryptophan/tyrosine transport system substrate-binding protein